MAASDVTGTNAERSGRRRPFATLMKRLTNLKGSDTTNSKKSNNHFSLKKSSNNRPKNNPYPESDPNPKRPNEDEGSVNGNLSYSTRQSRPVSESAPSIPSSDVEQGNLPASTKSNAPTLATNPDTINSEAGQSRAFTTKTTGGVSSVDGVPAGSTFSSPNQSEHSLTTTLTTIQSTSPGMLLNSGQSVATPTGPERRSSATASIQFSHQFPPSGVVSALPPHMAPSPNPTTYNTATANNLLSDDASILTLASSSKRRRRRSMDTDASVRALAPNSVFGGSRESLPLSILSGNPDPSTPGHGRPHPAEVNSIYSASGVGAPALVSDRNSYYATSVKQSIRDRERDRDKDTIDGRSLYEDSRSLHGGKSIYDGRNYEGSIKSGRFGHVRSDSNAGSVNAALVSPGVTTTRQANDTTASRRSSTYGNDNDNDEGEIKDDHTRDIS